MLVGVWRGSLKESKLGMPTLRWKNNMKIYLKVMGWENL